MATKLQPVASQTDSIQTNAHQATIDTKLDSTHENEVGYKEYLEGLDMVVSDQESRRFLDRSAINYANLFDYPDALGLEGNQFNYVVAMVYAGYFFGQYPCGWLIGRFKTQRVLAISCALWGFMVIMTTQARTFGGALAVRFIMGLFEAAVTPGLTLMTGWWYQRREIPLRQCIWYSSVGLGGIVGSYISMGISKMPENSTPARWEVLFDVLGGVTILWSVVIYIFLPDAPSNARFLNERERIIAVKRVSHNKTGIKNKTFDKKQAIVAFSDPKLILIWISVFAAAIPNGVVNSFSTIIIAELGFSDTKTTQLKSVGDAVQVIALLIGGAITLNIPNSRLLTATAAQHAVCDLRRVHGLPPKIKHMGTTPYMFVMNRRRDRKYGPPNRERSDEAGMRDMTEFENKDFRYVL
ncbi:hypothetical protein LTR37_009646 [Vermiconidia calcicola]|uniref:Uncharacterized protein n=1 Tax=Vermiconidia calcicola TaxID=1690605 RepID=A0ACC3N764_9PEZI|nr:hypothetical protein LTR37_009646 [Vermiconidia calcicola]